MGRIHAVSVFHRSPRDGSGGSSPRDGDTSSAGFEQFREPELRDRIPDPQAAATFEASRLRWAERGREPHASVLRLYEALLTLRRTAAALYDPSGTVRVEVLDDDTLALRRDTGDQQHALLAIVRLRGGGSLTLPRGTGEVVSLDDRFALALSTESPAFASDSAAARSDDRR